MSASAKLRTGGLRKQNDKLEQDIAEMESVLYQQKARLINDSSIRSQISKASGNSNWLSGAKGQLSGYRSHKELPQNHGLSDKNTRESFKLITRANSAGVAVGRRGRTQSFTPVSENRDELVTRETTGNDKHSAAAKTVGSREPVKGSSRVKSAPVQLGYTRKSDRGAQHERTLSLQGGIKVNALQSQKTNRNSRVPQSGKINKNEERRVSFDLSDDDDSPTTSAPPGDPVFDHGEPIIKTVTRSTASGGSKTPEAGSYADRIAHLKAKVIAKASASLKPEVLSNLPKKRHNGTTDVTAARTYTNKTGSREVNSQRSSSANSGTFSKPARDTAARTYTNKTGSREVNSQRSSSANSGTFSKPPRDTTANPGARKNKANVSKNNQQVSKGKTIHLQDHTKKAGHSKTELDKGDSDADSYFDASVELWLCSLHLEDSLECIKIFRRTRVGMDCLPSLTESQLIEMGVTADSTRSKILQGIEKLHNVRKLPPRTVERNEGTTSRTSRHHEEGMSQTTKLMDLMDGERFEEVITLKSSSPPTASCTPMVSSSSWSGDAAVGSAQSHRPSSAEMSLESKWTNKTEGGSGDLTSPDSNRKSADNKIETERLKSGKANPKKRGKTLSADVVNRTLTSGVQSAMTKLRQKQEQELNAQKRQDRLRQAKKSERDKLALQHAKRQQEKLEQMQAGEGQGQGEDGEGGAEEDMADLDEESSPEASRAFQSRDGCSEGVSRQTQDVKRMGIHGGALLNKTLPSNQNDQDDSLVTDNAPKAARSPRGTPGDRLKDLELNIQGLQDKESPATTATQVEKLQQQLASLKQDLTAANVAASATGALQSAAKSSGPARGVYSSMSKNELMREVRKQKEQHKKHIRLLESELSRLKHRDPVRSCELPEGDILYHQEDGIGEGTFSQVFRGYFNGSDVAIKRLKIPLDAGDRNYFAEEVSLLHELRHPRIVLLLGVCTTGTLPLMVLEYMAGGSLYARIHDASRVCLDHVAYYQVARDIALGMNYLHRHRPQVLHLDLKSMNVLLGMHGRAKIGDFGFAKLRHEAETLQKGKVQGTPAWMAPELMENSANSLTDKVDVYSFSVIMWEMLTGLQPYKGLSVFQVLEAVQQKKRPDIPASCPPPLRSLIKACWDHKPNKRPSFKDILIALEALAFPPEWRSLLSAANIPREAMKDPTSARSIIALVNGSVQLTQRELDEWALASHERAMDINSAGGSEELGLETRKQPANRVEVSSGSSADTINEDIVYDSLDEETNPSIEHRMLQGNEIRPRLAFDDDKQKLASPSHSKDYHEDVFCRMSPRSSKETSAADSNMYKHEIPVPPPIQPVMGTQPYPLVSNPQRSKAPQTTRLESNQALPAGRASLDPNLLAAQRKNLRTTEAGPHPSQLPSLSELGEQRMTSIAEILKKAVAARRTALREDGHSLEYSNSESLWSAVSDGY